MTGLASPYEKLSNGWIPWEHKSHIQSIVIPRHPHRRVIMVSREEVDAAVEKAKEILSDCGIDLDTTADQLIDWFDTELPIPDIALGDVVLNPLLVVHELVEIDEVLKMGLEITKDVIIRNPEKVDDAHLKAAKVELMVARSLGAVEHLRERVKDMEKRCVDQTLAESRRAEYGRLVAEAKDHLLYLQGRSA